MKNNLSGFDKLWQGLQGQKDIQEFISLHLKERKFFLDFTMKYVNELIHKRKKVSILEAGCGTAIDSCYVAKNTKAHIWVIDVSPQAIKFAKEIKKFFDCQIELKIGNINKTDFESNFFDLIFSQGTIEHLHVPLAAMREQVRILKSDGYLIVSVPQKYNIYTFLKFVLKVFKKWPYGWERSYTISELHKLGKQAGLKIIDICSWGVKCELYKSKRIYIRVIGRLYNMLMKIFYRLFSKYSVHFLQDVCVVYIKDLRT